MLGVAAAGMGHVYAICWSLSVRVAGSAHVTRVFLCWVQQSTEKSQGQSDRETSHVRYTRSIKPIMQSSVTALSPRKHLSAGSFAVLNQPISKLAASWEAITGGNVTTAQSCRLERGPRQFWKVWRMTLGCWCKHGSPATWSETA
eukprot:353460-Chlamydomonas_euryale.AAC.4